MKLPFGQNLHDAYDILVGAGKNKEDTYNYPGGKVIEALDQQNKFFKENEMVNAHEHNECQHEEMKYCKTCDLSYCKKCLREWGACRLNHFYTYYPQPATFWPYTTTTSTAGNTWSGTVVYQCNHS